jgi:hypothetical protein
MMKHPPSSRSSSLPSSSIGDHKSKNYAALKASQAKIRNKNPDENPPKRFVYGPKVADKKQALRLAFYVSLITLMNRIHADSSNNSNKTEFKCYSAVYKQLIVEEDCDDHHDHAPRTPRTIVDAILTDSIFHKSSLLETGNLLLMMEAFDSSASTDTTTAKNE